MKILITNLYSAANRGDAAIIKGMKAALQEYFPNSEFVVLSKHYEVAQKITEISSFPQLIVRLKFLDYFKLVYLLIWAWLYGKGVKLPALGMEDKIRNYTDADLILSAGGGYLNDNFPIAMIRWLFEFYFGKLLGKKVVIYSNSVGPFNRSWLKPFERFVLNRVDLITLRDRESKIALDSIGVSSPGIHVTADAAWCMETLKSEEGFQLLRQEFPELNQERLKISISVKYWDFYEEDTQKSHKEYLQAIAGLAEHLVEKHNAQVFFLSTCTSLGGYRRDDRVIAKEIVRSLKNTNSVKIIEGEYLPQQLSAIYANMDVHIGTRMHSDILAMLAGTPVVAIQYEPKTQGMMGLFGLRDWIISIEQITPQALIRIADKAIAQRASIKKQILEKLPEVKNKSKENARLVRDLCK